MNLDLKRENVKKWASYGLIGLVGLFVSPIIFLAIKGLVGLIIAGVVGMGMVTFTPWLAMKFANWKVKSIMAEAKENPIETMINLLAAKKHAFDEFRTNVENSAAARDTFKQKCDSFAKKYPARAVEFQTQLERMADLVERKTFALIEAKKSIAEGEHKLEEMQAYWEMSKDAIALNKAAGMDTGDMFEKLKADTACDAVFESMNRAFAQLEVASALEVDLVDKQAPIAQITNNSSAILELPSITLTKTRNV